MEYKGYLGAVEFDDEAEMFHGRVDNIRAVVSFYGRTVEELRFEFKQSVDDYLDFCQQEGVAP